MSYFLHTIAPAALSLWAVLWHAVSVGLVVWLARRAWDEEVG